MSICVSGYLLMLRFAQTQRDLQLGVFVDVQGNRGRQNRLGRQRYGAAEMGGQEPLTAFYPQCTLTQSDLLSDQEKQVSNYTRLIYIYISCI